MTDLEKIQYAKTFIDKLANGVNPLDDTPIPDNDIANNVRLSRCFFFVSDILRQVCENGGVTKPKRSAKVPFSVTLEQLENFEFSLEPIPITEITRRMIAITENENMRRLSYKRIIQWLLNIGMLQLCEVGGKKPVKRPTSAGIEIGIVVESRMGRYGEYQAVLYNESAQHFILDNLDAILATTYKKTKNYSEYIFTSSTISDK